MTDNKPSERKVCPQCQGEGSIYDPPLEQQDKEAELGTREWATRIVCPTCIGSGLVVDCPVCDTWKIETLHNEQTGRTDHIKCRECMGSGIVSSVVYDIYQGRKEGGQ